MRIVLDTNVVLSALLWRGTPYQLLDAIRQRGEARLFTRPALLDELAEVLTRPSATKQLAVIGRTVREVLADYVEAAEVVDLEHVPRVELDDADDDQVIATALAAGADWIVSGDADLLSMGSHQGIPILTAAQAAQSIAGSTKGRTAAVLTSADAHHRRVVAGFFFFYLPAIAVPPAPTLNCYANSIRARPQWHYLKRNNCRINRIEVG